MVENDEINANIDDYTPFIIQFTDFVLGNSDVISHKNNTKQRHVSGQICPENTI